MSLYDSAFKSGLAVLSGARNPEGVRLTKFYPLNANVPWYSVKYNQKLIGLVFPEKRPTPQRPWELPSGWTFQHRSGDTGRGYPTRNLALHSLIYEEQVRQKW